MSTKTQIAANQANAQHSSGPKTAEGKAASSRNNFRHGFTGQFVVLTDEDPAAFEQLLHGLEAEHNPFTFTEHLLVEKMAQHHWLRQRALLLQNLCFEGTPTGPDPERSLALYIRYQTTNERAFDKCLTDLLKLRAERGKQEIGFESQQRLREEHARRQNVEVRKQDLHKCNVWLAEAKAEHQELLNHKLETPETRMPNRVQRILARQQAA